MDTMASPSEWISHLRELGITGIRNKTSTAFTTWCMAFLSTLLNLINEILGYFSLPPQYEQLFFVCVAAMGILLLGWGKHHIYKLLFVGFTTVTLVVTAMVTSSDWAKSSTMDRKLASLGAGLLVGLYGGYKLVVWYRKQVIAVTALLGFISGGLVGYGILAAIRSALELCNMHEQTSWLDEAYHTSKATLHYPSAVDAYMCLSGEASHCKPLVVEDVIYLTAMVIVSIQMFKLFKYALAFVAEVEFLFAGDKASLVKKFAEWLAHGLYLELIFFSGVLATACLAVIKYLGGSEMLGSELGLTFVPWHDAEMPVKMLLEILVYTTTWSCAIGCLYRHMSILDSLVTSLIGAMLTTTALDHFAIIGEVDELVFGLGRSTQLLHMISMAENADCQNSSACDDTSHGGAIFFWLFAFGVVFQNRSEIFAALSTVWRTATWLPRTAANALSPRSTPTQKTDFEVQGATSKNTERYPRTNTARERVADVSDFSAAQHRRQQVPRKEKDVVAAPRQPRALPEHGHRTPTKTASAAPLTPYPEFTRASASKLKVPELRQQLKELGEDPFGSKQELVQRLLAVSPSKRKREEVDSECSPTKRSKAVSGELTKRKRA